MQTPCSQTAEPSEAIIKQETSSILNDALELLDDLDRELLYFRFVLGLTYEKLGGRLGWRFRRRPAPEICFRRQK